MQFVASAAAASPVGESPFVEGPREAPHAAAAGSRAAASAAELRVATSVCRSWEGPMLTSGVSPNAVQESFSVPRLALVVLLASLLVCSVSKLASAGAAAPEVATATTELTSQLVDGVNEAVQGALTAREALTKAASPKDRISTLQALQAAKIELQKTLAALKASASKAAPTGAQKDRVDAAQSGGEKTLDDTEADISTAKKSIATDAIGKAARPMTAVLFTPAFRSNAYQVEQDPADATKGRIVQTDSGGIAGVMIAAEAPFAMLELGTTKYPYLPIGAWFGVQLQTGSGTSVGTVDLTAGISLTLLSKASLATYINETGAEAGVQPARLLLGLTYGKSTSLGGGLKPGDPFPLGATPPQETTSRFEFTFGFGFRF